MSRAWGCLTDATLRSSGTSLRSTSPSGLLQLGARFHSPQLARFIQQDPIGSGTNWYTYVGNNPVVFIDPEGLGILDTIKKPFEALGAWIGDTIWPDKSDPHPCTPGTTGSQDHSGAGGAALAIGGLATAAAGHGATAIGDAAGKAGSSSGFWTTAGGIAKGGGYAAAIVGGIIAFRQTKAKAISGAGKPVSRFDETGGHQGPSRKSWRQDMEEQGLGSPEDLRLPSGGRYLEE
ncbi:MAG: RHS repeat-associated core domain-containing protein [Armatimonadota bacterium]|nr:MAG: RHS repeat-associated core domain-containing protein [Armatimonadota bacterium]